MAAEFVLGAVRQDPEVAFSFEAYTTDGVIPRGSFGFSEVSGLRGTTNPIEYKVGTDNYIRKLPGRTSVENVTIRRGLDRQKQLRQWYNQVAEDKIQLSNGVPVIDFRKTLVVEQLARGAGGVEAHVVRKWVLSRVWPCAIETSDLRGDADEVTVESLELCYEQINEEGIDNLLGAAASGIGLA